MDHTCKYVVRNLLNCTYRCSTVPMYIWPACARFCACVQKLNGKYHFAVAALQPNSPTTARQQDVTVATRCWRLSWVAASQCRPSSTPATVTPPHLLAHAHRHKSTHTHPLRLTDGPARVCVCVCVLWLHKHQSRVWSKVCPLAITLSIAYGSP